MKHPKNVEKYNGSLDELAEDIGNLSYDDLAYLIKCLGDKLTKDSKCDNSKGRLKLAGKLELAAKDIYSAREKIMYAWDKYCKNRTN